MDSIILNYDETVLMWLMREKKLKNYETNINKEEIKF